MSIKKTEDDKSGVLTLIFSLTTLDEYVQSGQYDRFIRILGYYSAAFESVNLCSADTRDYTASLGFGNVRHLGMPRIPVPRYSALVFNPLLHWKVLRKTTVVRTYNTPGGNTGALIRSYSGASVFVSYGYSWAEFVRRRSRTKAWLATLIEARALQAADHLLVATPAQQSLLEQRYPTKPVTVIPNSVDTDSFRPIEKDVDGIGPYLLFVGRIERQKNLALLLSALSLLKKEGLNVPLVVVGDGSVRAEAEARARELGLPVSFRGAVPHSALPRLYAQSQAYVLCSDYEGMPKTLIEAMASGKACIGTDVAGIRDLLADGDTGALVPAGDSESLADALKLVWQDESLRKHLGRGARAYVEEHLSMQATMEREITILKKQGL